MPKTKNQGKNKSRFEVRGGLLNEYEFALNEGAMTEEERNRLAQMEGERQLREGAGEGEPVPMSPQEREAARIREVMETAHEKAQRNIEKRERREAASGKGAARKGAAKRASKAGAGKKGGKGEASKKAGAGKGAQKRGAAKSAKKGAGKKSAGKKGTQKSAKKGGGAAGGGRGGASRQGAGARKGAAKKGSAKKGGRSRRA